MESGAQRQPAVLSVDEWFGLPEDEPGELKVGDRRGRMPDASAYLPGGAKPPLRGLVEVPPDIAIEVVSATPKDMRRDRIEKMSDYADFRVRFYWLIDPVARLLEVYELEDGGLYRRAL